MLFVMLMIDLIVKDVICLAEYVCSVCVSLLVLSVEIIHEQVSFETYETLQSKVAAK